MSIDIKYNPQENEPKEQELWFKKNKEDNKKGIYEWDETLPKKLDFIIDTPPPTVSGFLHMGHVFSYCQTDFVARYQRMIGKNVFYPIGFDDNGLPTERLVEKTNNVKGSWMNKQGKKDEFIKMCYDVVDNAEREFEKLFKTLGISYDWRQKYQTIAPTTKEYIWKTFETFKKAGLAEQRTGPVYWDVVDQTALAQSIIEDKEVDGAEHYLIWNVFDAKDSEKSIEQVEIMTTRPELLPACVAVFYNPEDPRFAHLKGKYIQFSNITEKVPCLPDEAVRIDKGTGLVMCCTYGDWQDVEWVKKYNLKSKIIVNKEGRFRKEQTLFEKDFYQQNEKGQYPKAKEARKYILDYIQKQEQENNVKLIKEIKPIKHIVKVGERSKEPVEIIESIQWYVKDIQFREDSLYLANLLEFHPAHFKNRLIQWIGGLNQDWCISRDRFFGIEIPFDYNGFEELKEDLIEEYEDCENFIEEYCNLQIEDIEHPFHYLEGCYTNGILDDYTTQYKEYNKEWKEKYEKIEEKYAEKENYNDIKNEIDEFIELNTLNQVFDTWFTSSSSPFISTKIREDGRLVPTSLRPQAHEIIRTWTFTTLLKTYLMKLCENDNKLLNERAKWLKKGKTATSWFEELGVEFCKNNFLPWKDVMLSGWCLAKDGNKMSKSAGNVITPTSLIEEKGSDIVRYWSASCSLGVDTAFNETKFLDGKKLINKLINSTKFAVSHFEKKELQNFIIKETNENGTTFAMVLDKKEGGKKNNKQELHFKDLINKTTDKWIISRLQSVIEEYKKSFNEFEYSQAKYVVERFFWDEFCDNYLEICKARAYNEDESALITLRIMTEAFLLLFAPFIPHVTSTIYREIFGNEVHERGMLNKFICCIQQEYDSCNDSLVKATQKTQKIALEIINFIRQKKAEMKISIKAPIKKLIIPNKLLDDCYNSNVSINKNGKCLQKSKVKADKKSNSLDDLLEKDKEMKDLFEDVKSMLSIEEICCGDTFDIML